jgi:hypothetical protein
VSTISRKRSGRPAAEFNHRGFWSAVEERHPEEKAARAKHGPWFWQRGLPHLEIVITMYVAPERNLVGVFFGRNERLGAVDVPRRLRPHWPRIKEALKLKLEQEGDIPGIGSIWRVNCFAEDNWPAMADWLVTEAARFEDAIGDIFSAQQENGEPTDSGNG